MKDLNCYVAVAEEFPNDAPTKVKAGGLLHDRRVSRIVTPGTLIDENFMDPYANNYILAVHMEDDLLPETMPTLSNEDMLTSTATELSSLPMGLAWLDLSTGQFFTQSITVAMLPSAISRVAPSEIVLAEGSRSSQAHALFSILKEDNHLFTYCPPSGSTSILDWNPMLESDMSVGLAAEFSPNEVSAGSLLLHYIKTRLQGLTVKMQPPQRYMAMETMGIDRNSMRALEIKETSRDGLFRGSLLHAIRRTVTKGGARLLSEWLSTGSLARLVLEIHANLLQVRRRPPSGS